MTSATDIVAALLAELPLDVPYALYGHSMGSLLAYECALALPRVGQQAPVSLFVSGRNAPSAQVRHDTLHTLEDAALIKALRARYGTHGAGVLDDVELRELFLPIVRADLQVVETYSAGSSEPVRCPVQAFAGIDDASVSVAGLEAWAATSSGVFIAQRLPGDHFFHFGEGQVALVHHIADSLTR